MRCWVVAGFYYLIAGFPALAVASDFKGRWATEGGRSHIEVKDCDDQLCGRIIWLRKPVNAKGEALRDKRNSAEDLRSRYIVGILVLKVGKTDKGTWEGRVYDPERGQTFPASAEFKSENVLQVTGCAWMGWPCKSRLWKRIETTDPAFQYATQVPMTPRMNSATTSR